jgi:hypothetical protein
MKMARLWNGLPFVGSLMHRRRRSDDEAFVETDVDIEALAATIFGRYAGEQNLVIDGVPGTATFFQPDYCPDYRVMTLAGRLALAVNRRSRLDPDFIAPLRVTVREVMLAALLHDLGKHHEDCSPFIARMQTTDLRGDTAADAARRAHLLGVVRDVHCRKGPCMIDRLRDANRPELHNPFIATVARRHGDDYLANRTACWWPREINVITLADDYDAMMSAGPERAYRSRPITGDEAVRLLRDGAERGRYEPRLTDIFINDVLGLSTPA